MWFKLNDEQDARYEKLKGKSVSRNYDIRKALVEGKSIPPLPRLEKIKVVERTILNRVNTDYEYSSIGHHR